LRGHCFWGRRVPQLELSPSSITIFSGVARFYRLPALPGARSAPFLTRDKSDALAETTRASSTAGWVEKPRPRTRNWFGPRRLRRATSARPSWLPRIGDRGARRIWPACVSSFIFRGASRIRGCTSGVLKFRVHGLPPHGKSRCCSAAAVREFAETEMRPHVREWDEQQHFPDRADAEACRARACSASSFPDAYGGSAMERDRLLHLHRGSWRASIRASPCRFAAHNGPLLVAHFFASASEVQKQTFLGAAGPRRKTIGLPGA